MSKSSSEAGYRSMSYVTSEMIWLSRLIVDFFPIPLYCDNKSVIHLANIPVFHEWTKHLNIDCHFVREKLEDGFLMPKHVRTGLQLADIMTKALAPPQHKFHSEKLGLTNYKVHPP